MQAMKGIRTVMDNLNKELKTMNGNLLKGCLRGALILRRASELEAPKVPAKWGNLRASWTTVSSDGKTSATPTFKNDKDGKLSAGHHEAVGNAKSLLPNKGVGVIFGYTAHYALFVHEMGEEGSATAGMTINWTRTGSGSKFFERTLHEKRDEVLKVIAKEAQI